MQRPSSLPASMAALTVAVLLIGGCSSERGAGPAMAPEQAQPPRVREQAPSGLTGLPEGRGRGGQRQFGGNDRSATVLIDGEFGGVVHLGRFTLTVPRGSFLGVVPITIDLSNNGFVECQLLPEGLYFNVPATLEIDLNGTTGDHAGVTVIWLDPLAGRNGSWVDMNGKYDPNSHSVKATLQHFSCWGAGERYGRAGW